MSPTDLRPEAADALRTLLGEVSRVQALLIQPPDTDVVAVARAAQEAHLGLLLVANFLQREGL